MKRIIQGLVFAAIAAGAQAAWSDSLGFLDADAGYSLPAQWTYADRHLTNADKHRPAFDFGGTTEFASPVPITSTYADRHLTDADKRRPAFDFGGTTEFASPLPITSTYADRHAKTPERAAHVQTPDSLPAMH